MGATLLRSCPRLKKYAWTKFTSRQDSFPLIPSSTDHQHKPEHDSNHHLPRKTAQEGGCHAGGLRRLATRIWKTLENCIAFQAFIYFHLQLLSLLGRSSVGPVFARLAAGKSIAVTGIFALASRFVPSNGCKENEKNTEAVSTLALNLRSNSEISRARQSIFFF